MGPQRHWRSFAAAGALLSLLVIGARCAGAGAMAAAPEPVRQIQLQTTATESLRATLRQAGLDVAESNGAAFAMADLFDPERPPPGLTMALKVEPADAGDGLRLIELVIRRGSLVVATLSHAADGSFRLDRDPGAPAPDPVEVASQAVHEAPAVLQGPMEDVLYGDPGTTTDALVILQAARLFARRLDLTRDLALGDEVRLVFTRKVAADGRIIGSGSLLYAEIDTHGGPARFYAHRRAHTGETDFVDESGADFSDALLRTPVDGARITSGFGMRMHPLLGYTRMHQGLDFGAPVGSAVLAAGDAVVEEVRWAGGYGRWIKLRHSAEFETGYGHLSGWATGLRVGQHVHQGQVIGYVGSTGLSTGPHLHYEVMEDGHPVDPKTVQPTERVALTGAELATFQVEKRTIAALLDHAASVRTASAGAGDGR